MTLLKLNQEQAKLTSGPRISQPQTDSEDLTIASTINPKRKGWAWKKGHPIAFTDTVNASALIRWAATQRFWHAHATDFYTNDIPGARWQDVYTDLCLEVAEGRITQAEYAFNLRKLVVAAIRAFDASDTKVKA